MLQIDKLKGQLNKRDNALTEMKDELNGMKVDRDYYQESCKIHRKNHEKWMENFFSRQLELQELTLEFIEDIKQKSDVELTNLKRKSCGSTPPSIKQKRSKREIIEINDSIDENDSE